MKEAMEDRLDVIDAVFDVLVWEIEKARKEISRLRRDLDRASASLHNIRPIGVDNAGNAAEKAL
jgi:hypothetical protein